MHSTKDDLMIKQERQNMWIKKYINEPIWTQMIDSLPPEQKLD